MRRLRWLLVAAAALSISAVAVTTAGADRSDSLHRIKHIVVIYQENHSFDNLYGGWEGVNGVAGAPLNRTLQVDQNGDPYSCLRQLDVNLTSPPLSTVCSAVTPNSVPFNSHFLNSPFTIDGYIPSTAVTCPPETNAFAFPNGLLNGDPRAHEGGCTRDIVHKFYQEIYQLNGGAQNRYATGSDAAGLVMGVYDTKKLRIYDYLHSAGHPSYAIADNFFQAAFGGSFLNHQWLIAAATPIYPNPKPNSAGHDIHSSVDSAGFPRNNYPLYKPEPGATYFDGDLTVTCDSPVKPGGACGDYAVNTMQPPYWPKGRFGETLEYPQTNPTIGDRLTAAGVDWAWYAGGWDNAVGNTTGLGWTNGTTVGTCGDPHHDPANSTYPRCPDALFQYHHQPFNYFASYAPGQPGREHLQDEENFIHAVKSSGNQCNLKPVSFIKPVGEENEHPGYASEKNGGDHLVDELLKPIEASVCARDTMVVVTYDEFGGQWDHVSPPGQGNNNGPHDQWGPGTRIPALVISPFLKSDFVVDHTQYDTTSIVATIERRWHLDPLGTRDAAVNDLSNVYFVR